MRVVFAALLTAVVLGCSKVAGLSVEAPYASLAVAQATVAEFTARWGFIIVPKVGEYPYEPGFQGFRSVIRAERAPSGERRLLRVGLEASEYQQVIQVYLGRGMDHEFSEEEQLIAADLINRLRGAGIELKVKFAEGLRVPE